MALVFRGTGTGWALLISGCLSLAVEVAQFWIPGRDPDIWDLTTNTLGGAIGVFCARSGWGDATHRAVASIAFALAQPASRLSSRLALGTSFMVMTLVLLTGFLHMPSFPESTYLAGFQRFEKSEMPLRIGGDTIYGEHMHGMIDEVRIYNRALTPGEIRSDMHNPISGTPPTKGLVAAFGFDEGGGTVVKDCSGRGHSGTNDGATWTDRGKFGQALMFDGRNSMVTIPPSADLSFEDEMTLSAWAYPLSGMTGWRQIIKKEVDAYYLAASSDEGAFMPAGGGTFGTPPEFLRSPIRINPNQWVHLALTYDGSAFCLYRDGDVVIQQSLWYPGKLLHASIGGVDLVQGVIPDPSRLAKSLPAGARLSVVVQSPKRSPLGHPLPIVRVTDPTRKDTLNLSANGADLSFRVRTRAMNLGLDSPAIVFCDAMKGTLPGEPIAIEVWRNQGRWEAKVNGSVNSEPGFTVGMGWQFLCASEHFSAPLRTFLNWIWVVAIVFPGGFWARRRGETAAAGVVLVVSMFVLPRFSGLAPTSSGELGAAIVGVLAGVTLHGKRGLASS